jgi:U32 family peptidase
MRNKIEHKPELLLPAGNAEAFYAAIESGADAIYFGLKDFNARNRAMNFTPWQVAAMVKLAHHKKVKCYITLNTVVRNFELSKLIDSLYVISQTGADGIIIQDLGVMFIAKKYFPDLNIHASTQMFIHNSLGVEHAGISGIKRVVLARELTMNELASISEKAETELEIFTHGALCYSFSGVCLFSSFHGGASANRGLCTQPCRRIYRQDIEGKKIDRYFFSLKDNQLIDFIPQLSKFSIQSLKVEGRLKPGEYVFNVGKAYRMAIDDSRQIDEAKALLLNDLGREKTGYFAGSDVSAAITQAATTGILIGKVTESKDNFVTFSSNLAIEEGFRLRFRNPHNDKQFDLKADNIKVLGDKYALGANSTEIKQGDEVYLAGRKLKLPQKINTEGINIKPHYKPEKANHILNALKMRTSKTTNEIFIRIDKLDWLNHLDTKQVDTILLQLSQNEMEILSTSDFQIKCRPDKLMIELPKFMAEEKINFYKENLEKLFKKGFKNFIISHISQKLIIPKGAKIATNENIYMFNDAAIRFLKDEGIENFIFPLENDIANLVKGSNRSGIIPMYYFPPLFYSRMPVDLEREKQFSDKSGVSYFKTVRDGITIVIPEKPVSILQYRSKLERFGFTRYLLDFSFSEPSGIRFNTIMNSFKNMENIKDSSIFNFKRELK